MDVQSPLAILLVCQYDVTLRVQLRFFGTSFCREVCRYGIDQDHEHSSSRATRTHHLGRKSLRSILCAFALPNIDFDPLRIRSMQPLSLLLKLTSYASTSSHTVTARQIPNETRCRSAVERKVRFGRHSTRYLFICFALLLIAISEPLSSTHKQGYARISRLFSVSVFRLARSASARPPVCRWKLLT
jgi:hypothetical protein